MGCVCQKLKERKFSKVSQKPDDCIGQEKPELSESQKAVLRNNWQVLKLHVANVGVITFVSMFESRPDLKEVFSNFRGKEIDELKQSGLIRAHALRVMATVDKCVTRLDEPANLANILRELGAHHNQYKVNKDHIKSILPAFIHAIKPHILDYWSDDVEKAWRTFLLIILYHIGEGMAKKSKSQQRQDRVSKSERSSESISKITLASESKSKVEHPSERVT